MDSLATRYFVTKCDRMQTLQKANNDHIWACSERKSSPQPHQILRDAFENSSKVVLIYSVSSCHGWHGYARMTSAPLRDSTPQSQPNDTHIWYRFGIQWENLFLTKHGEHSLSSTYTEQLKCLDDTPVNKARNLQELPVSSGQAICDLIDKHILDLDLEKEKRQQRREDKREAPFLNKQETNIEVICETLISKVEKLGDVILACAFGSQRYNLHTPESDIDMFVVYAAATENVLGFSPPKHTIKNTDKEMCDYTVHELHRYCELLLQGDARCVETLFLHPSCVYRQAPQHLELCKRNTDFLTINCVDRYMRDATGNKGLKLLEKWVRSGEAEVIPMLPKVSKLSYIILRLLFNARDVCHGKLEVFRERESPQWQLLMNIRCNQCSYGTLKKAVDGLLEDINSHKENYEHEENAENKLHEFVLNWLLWIRYEDLKRHLESH